MLVKIGDFEFSEVWDGVFYKKLSDYPHISDWERRTLTEFMAYEELHGRSCPLECEDEGVLQAVSAALSRREDYQAVPRPALLTECTACPHRRGCVTEYVCHTTSADNARSILRSGSLLSACRARQLPAEVLMRESRNAARDPADYFDYIMFTWGNCQAGDRLVTERRLGRFPDERDLSQDFRPGVRFYFQYDRLVTHPAAIFDGVLPLKVRDELRLNEWVYRIVIPAELRDELEAFVPASLAGRTIYVENDCRDIWDWSEKVYRMIEGSAAPEVSAPFPRALLTPSAAHGILSTEIPPIQGGTFMIAKHPPMGWNSWDCYGAAVTEDIVRKNAEYMAEHLKPYGWEYVVVDIQWYQPTASSHEYEPFSTLDMDEYGRLLPAVNRFPSAAGGAGFKPLADYIHSLGLKFGIHIMRGMPRMAAHKRLPIKGSDMGCHEVANPNSICAWNPDMYGLRCDKPGARAYYESIFQLYAQWGVDFVKCDDIAREYPHCKREIELISDACRASGRDMVLSLSPGPAPLERAEHLKRYANMWRITDDFWDKWELLKGMFERAEKWCIHSGPGHWPDADMLPLGALRQDYNPDDWTKFTQEEQRTMMTLWSMMRSPLMIGAEMTKNDEFTLSLLQNADVLNIGKESFCGHPLWTTESESVWVAPRKDGQGVYVALFNLSDEERTVSVCREQAEIGMQVTELWSGKAVSAPNGLSAALAPHDAVVYLVK